MPRGLQAAQEAVKHLEADLASALDGRDAVGSEAHSAGVLRAEVAVLHARNARILQETAAFRARGEEARKQVQPAHVGDPAQACPQPGLLPTPCWLPQHAHRLPAATCGCAGMIHAGMVGKTAGRTALAQP